MTFNHSLFRPASVLSIRAAFLACALGAPASADAVDALSHTASTNRSFVLIQAQTERSPMPAPIQAALDLLQWSPDHVPLIEVVEVRPPTVSPLAEGWTVHNGDGSTRRTIYVAGWSALYRDVLRNRLDVHLSVIRLAGVLAHERAHIEHGQNEELAYLAQLITLEHLRAHDIDIANVRRALEAVKRQQRGRR